MLIEPITRTRIATRLAQPSDIPALQDLIAQSARGLMRNQYTRREIDSMLTYLIGVDRQLIDDHTYYVAEIDGQIAGSGGWSYHNELVGTATHADSALADGDHAARIRIMFVHPDFARRGIGSELLHLSEAAARSCGYHEAKLVATLTGVPFYARYGWHALGPIDFRLPDGVTVTGMNMRKSLD